MGWKIFTTFIKNAGDVKINDDLVKSLGFKDFHFVEKTKFDFGPKIGALFIANHNGHLLIANADLIWQFTKPDLTSTVRAFTSKFPDKDIISLSIGYGTYFSVIEKGKIIRVREVGDKIYQDRGELLPEEKLLKIEDVIDPEDLAEMKKETSPEEVENQVQSELAYETAFRLTKRIFGKRLDELELSDYEFECLKFRNTKIDSVTDYGIQAEMQFSK